jgi:hypothetical protein
MYVAHRPAKNAGVTVRASAEPSLRSVGRGASAPSIHDQKPFVASSGFIWSCVPIQRTVNVPSPEQAAATHDY